MVSNPYNRAFIKEFIKKFLDNFFALICSSCFIRMG